MMVEKLIAQLRHADVTESMEWSDACVEIDENLMDDMCVSEGQSCEVILIQNTYVKHPVIHRTHIVSGGRASRCVKVHGHIATDIAEGDTIQINVYGLMTPETAKAHKPIILRGN